MHFDLDKYYKNNLFTQKLIFNLKITECFSWNFSHSSQVYKCMFHIEMIILL